MRTYCLQEGITLTRSRPYRKNDSCHIEQKNWSVVRRLVGYARFEWAALPYLARIYALARDYVNFCQPVRKLVEKTRHGAKVTKHYDRAQSLYQRLLASGLPTADVAAWLAARYAALNPVRLKLDLEAAQQTLYSRAARNEQPLRPRRTPLEKAYL